MIVAGRVHIATRPYGRRIGVRGAEEPDNFLIMVITGPDIPLIFFWTNT
jgi:hypothetical protein